MSRLDGEGVPAGDVWKDTLVHLSDGATRFRDLFSGTEFTATKTESNELVLPFKDIFSILPFCILESISYAL